MKFSPSNMFRFETAGESHGECLVATLTGLPAGIPISLDAVNRELWRRQQGYGRGGRMKIETDRAEIVAGVRHSKTIGAPIAIIIQNKDWKNWTRSAARGGFRRRAAKAQARIPAASRTRRSGRQLEVQFSGCPIHSGTRQRARDHGEGCGRRVGQSASWAIWHHGAEPRDRRGRSKVGTSGRVGRISRAEPERRSLAGLRGPRGRSAHERGCRPRISHRRHRGRRLRSGGARRCRPGLARTSLGIRGWTAGWRRPSYRCRR